MKKRCDFKNCNKSIKLYQQIECKCKLIFCVHHRFPINHNCEYDYRKEWTDKIRKENPIVVPTKIVLF